MKSKKSPKWLDSAVFYEIYPQSFCDSNSDGVGDLPGITGKLTYVKDLGCNALWVNPCFDSPFKDAGYDVRDYRKVAPRYGTNDDLVKLFEEAHRLGMHVLLDLVPGHTSEEHEWFVQSQKAERNEYSDRYIWTNAAFEGYPKPFISGESERSGAYFLNFFKCQPALNYGFNHIDRSWQKSVDSTSAKATREAMVDIVRFWLAKGCDGFRVDMADSLVKNDDEKHSATSRVWQEMFAEIRSDFPEAAFVSEWSNPEQSLPAGFDMDFYLDHPRGETSEANGYNLLARNVGMGDDGREVDHSYFAAKSDVSIADFLSEYLSYYYTTKDEGYFCFITGNHDTPRMMPRLTSREYKIALGMILTMPGVPFIYYGDEIGMRYRNLPTKEGGYHRTGSRTPMQWNDRANLGFSDADSEKLYLPVDPSASAPTVQKQINDPDSILNWVKTLLQLRNKSEALRAGSDFQVIAAPQDGRSFAFLRTASNGAERELIAMNPGMNMERIKPPYHVDAPTLQIGNISSTGNELSLHPQSFAVFPL